MKDDLWQKRQFILTSFRRLEIPFTSKVYRFADKLIREKWDSSSMDLNEVDHYIHEEFNKFLDNT